MNETPDTKTVVIPPHHFICVQAEPFETEWEPHSLEDLTVAEIDDYIQSVLKANTTSSWLKAALKTAIIRDPIDANNDSEQLYLMLSYRLESLTLENEMARLDSKSKATMLIGFSQ